jgi:hypothetical protein
VTRLPMEHIARPSAPWRLPQDARTECGLPVAGHPVLSRDAWGAKVKELGKQRAAFTTCMSCWSTADRWQEATFNQDPVQVVARETYGQKIISQEGREIFRDELLALGALVEAHREEYEAIRASLNDASRLEQKRRERARRLA